MHQKERKKKKTEAATVSVSAPDRGRGVAVAVGNDMSICTTGISQVQRTNFSTGTSMTARGPPV